MAVPDGGVLIDLDDAEERDPGPGDLDPASEDVPRRARRRARALAVAGAVVVLGIVATVGGAAALDERRTRERREALEALGVPLVDLSAPLEQAWGHERDVWPIVTTADVLVVQEYGAGGEEVVAYDAATGEPRWSREGADSCRGWAPTWSEVSGPVVGGSPWETAFGPAEPTWVVCETGYAWDGLPRADAVTRVELLDLADGRLLGEVELPGALVAQTLLGDDAAITTVDDAGRMVTWGVGLLTGDVAWSTDVGTGGFDEHGVFTGMYPVVVGSALEVTVGDAEPVYLDLETGEPTTPRPAEAPYAARFVLAGGVVVTSAYETEVDEDGVYAIGAERTVVAGPDGVERFAVDGAVWTPLFSDGSLADRVVVQEYGGEYPTLVAYDVADGRELWRRATTDWDWAVLQVDGVAITSGERLAGIDLRTGEERWRTDAVVRTGGLVTDGTRVLALEVDTEGTWLAAYDVGSGARTWRVPTFRGAWMFSPAGPGVLVSGDGGTAMFRPAG